MDKILAQVVQMENAGYQFEAAEASFDLLVRRTAGTFRPHFERLNFHVTVEAEGDGAVTTEATVKIRIGDTVRHEVAEGDGPVNALDAALRKALEAAYPNLAKMHLVDYKVRVINPRAATAAGVRVVIESRDEQDVWGTVGVSENIIEASWMALVDSLEYKLCKGRVAHNRRAAACWLAGRGEGLRIDGNQAGSADWFSREATFFTGSDARAMATYRATGIAQAVPSCRSRAALVSLLGGAALLSQRARRKATPFTIVIPPPNVTGALHPGTWP